MLVLLSSCLLVVKSDYELLEAVVNDDYHQVRQLVESVAQVELEKMINSQNSLGERLRFSLNTWYFSGLSYKL